ncbi:leucine-rich_repeat domain-containing protein [Hexamita inflata]|uniref:Leucine-rich repeat domain-containing protein n=1 Tax=Hexamita inflata TaxID=28002 RepID=A0AA86Q8L1_9EUKA|nr:leucine-rich repeat domain-containing protein [Hexamita inflata]
MNTNNVYTNDESITMQSFQNQIENESLSINRIPELTSLSLFDILHIKKLHIKNCRNLLPNMNNKTLTELYFDNCTFIQENVQPNEADYINFCKTTDSFKQKNINYNQIMELFSAKSDTRFEQMGQLRILTFNFCEIQHTNMLRPLNLVELSMSGNKGLDITFIQYQTNLTKLCLQYCSLSNLNALKTLSRLTDLNLDFNKGVNITHLQHLTQLTKVQLNCCGLINVDALQTLINLQYVSIKGNQIVYIQPMAELLQLSELKAANNNIIDIKTIEHHLNFYQFKFSDQQQPKEALIKAADMARDVNYQIKRLGQLKQQQLKLQSQYRIMKLQISDCLQESGNSREQFSFKAVSLFQQLNTSENIQ